MKICVFGVSSLSGIAQTMFMPENWTQGMESDNQHGFYDVCPGDNEDLCVEMVHRSFFQRSQNPFKDGQMPVD